MSLDFRLESQTMNCILMTINCTSFMITTWMFVTFAFYRDFVQRVKMMSLDYKSLNVHIMIRASILLINSKSFAFYKDFVQRVKMMSLDYKSLNVHIMIRASILLINSKSFAFYKDFVQRVKMMSLDFMILIVHYD